MSAEQVKVDYDALETVSNQFNQQAEAVESMRKQLDARVDTLRNGGWIGRGADAFYAEMDSEILPAIQRYLEAMQEASQVIKEISHKFSEAEDDACGCFNATRG